MRDGRYVPAWFLGGCAVALLLSGCVHQAPPPAGRCAPPESGRLVVPESVAGARCRTEEVSPETFLRADDGGLIPFGVGRVRRATCADPISMAPLAVVEEIDLASPLEAWAAASKAPPGMAVRAGCRLMRVLPGDGSDASLPVRRALLDLAAAVGGPDTPPAEVAALEALFPGERVTYEPFTVAGYRLLAPAVTVTVAAPGGRSATVFIATRDYESEVQEAFDRFAVSRSAGSDGAAFVLGIGESAVGVRDEREGWVTLAREGKRLYGVVGLPGASDGWRVVSALIARLQ